MSVKTTKKAAAPTPPSALRPEYRFDYQRSKPNRFAAEMRDTVAVVLDPDVAAVFNTSRKVNATLRSVISGAPRSNTTRRRRPV